MTGSEPAWVADLRAQGMTASWAGDAGCWVRFKRVAYLRYPTNDRAPLSMPQQRSLFWRHRMAVLQYHVDATEASANAVLYLCQDRNYSLDSLSSNNRSKVRRGLKQLTVGQVSADELIAHGYPAYADTRERHGTKAMTFDEFRRNWERQRVVAGRELWAAWAGEEIAAFGAVHRCGTWASISATVSHRDHQRSYPNHALFFRIIEHLMADPDVESVSYGLSSLRGETARDSLHHFKVSVGLDAVRVERRVVVHPLLRPAVNRVTLRAVGALERRVPSFRGPRAARAALEFLLDPGLDTQSKANAQSAGSNGPGRPDAELEVSRLTEADIDLVASLHRRAFPDYASSRLGHRYTVKLLQRFSDEPEAWVAVVRHAGLPVGYLVAAPPRLQRAIDRELRGAALMASVSHPRLLVEWVRRHLQAYRRRHEAVASTASAVAPEADGPPADVRVVLIGVEAKARGKGIGAALLEDFELRAKARGHREADLWVTTVNGSARSAYRRAGWSEREVVAAGVRYSLDLVRRSPAPGSDRSSGDLTTNR